MSMSSLVSESTRFFFISKVPVWIIIVTFLADAFRPSDEVGQSISLRVIVSVASSWNCDSVLSDVVTLSETSARIIMSLEEERRRQIARWKGKWERVTCTRYIEGGPRVVFKARRSKISGINLDICTHSMLKKERNLRRYWMMHFLNI